MIAAPGQTVYAAVDPSIAPLSDPNNGVPVLSQFQNGQCTNINTNFFIGYPVSPVADLNDLFTPPFRVQ